MAPSTFYQPFHVCIEGDIVANLQNVAFSFLPECDEDVCDGLEGGEEGEHDPVHHPLHLKQSLDIEIMQISIS